MLHSLRVSTWVLQPCHCRDTVFITISTKVFRANTLLGVVLHIRQRLLTASETLPLRIDLAMRCPRPAYAQPLIPIQARA